MSKSQVIIIGDTPGTYICAIYLYTANISVTVICKDLGINYECNYIPGCPDVNKEQYNQDCKNQAKNMGIAVIDSNCVKIQKNTNDVYTLTIDGNIFETQNIVVDKKIKEYDIEGVYEIVKEAEFPEAIVLAGAGCKVAFKVKENLVE